MSKERTPRVSVIMQNRDYFGAKIVQIPFLFSLREKYPGHEIVVLTPFENNTIFKEVGACDQCVAYDRTDFFSKIRKLKSQIVYNLRPESGTITRGLLACKLVQSFKLHTFDHPLLKHLATQTVPNNTQIYRAKNLLGFFSYESPGPIFQKHLHIRREAGEHVEIYFIIGAGEECKIWGLENFFKLSRELLKVPQVKLGFILGCKEGELLSTLDQFAAEAPERFLPTLYQRNLSEISEALKTASLVIGNDSGPSHLVQLSGIPFIGLYTDENLTANRVVAEWYDTESTGMAIKGNPKEHIRHIPVELVLAKAMEVLASALEFARQKKVS